jgi:signal transduction histidine kinase
VETESLAFRTDAALVDRLGRELVGKQETALVELIKNCYDADATIVDVKVLRDRIEISDDGSGMTRSELVDGFLRIAGDAKARLPLSPRFKRRRAGRKGIGRFATQRLGNHLLLRTRNEAEAQGLELEVDWSQFRPGVPLEDVRVRLKSIPADAVGTTLVISGLRDAWTEDQVKRCWRALQNLQRPFGAAPQSRDLDHDPGFLVRFSLGEGDDSGLTKTVDIETEILSHMHATVQLHVDEQGIARWRLSKNHYGPTTDWQPIGYEFPEGANAQPYSDLKDVWMEAHYVILRPSELSRMSFARLREWQSQEGGIRLYRNGFRVGPYGDPDDDWLQLDELYARRTELFPVANRNWFGVVEIDDLEGRFFEEPTSREGLIETPSFETLRKLLTLVLVTAARTIAEQREVRVNTRNPMSDSERVTRRLEEAYVAAKSIEARARNAGDIALASSASVAVERIEQAKSSIAEEQRASASEVALLQFLSTLGTLLAEFSHETGLTLEALRLDYPRVIDLAKRAAGQDQTNREIIENFGSMFERVDALNAYISEIASARALRELVPVSITKAIEDFARGVTRLAASNSITLEIRTPPLDDLRVGPMHAAEVASILLNFFSNSVKALKRVPGERRLLVEGVKDQQDAVIRFSDTGDGIPEENRERVFNPFFTTRLARPASETTLASESGSGLGLWIVRQIVIRAGGTVEVSSPIDGFATTMTVRLPLFIETR